MKLIDSIHAALSGFVTAAGQLWHTKLEPWLSGLLSNVVHAEVTALMPIAQEATQELVADLAGAKGNLQDFAAIAGQVLANAATKAQAASVTAVGSSLLTAVTAAIATHPEVMASEVPVAPVKADVSSGDAAAKTAA